jgi:integrase
MAKPYQDGKSWAFRLRLQGQDIFRSGFPSEAAARKEMNTLRAEIENADKASGNGPFQTSLGIALSDYARQKLPYLKSATQEARRINAYLRPLSLPVIQLEALEAPTEGANHQLRHFNVTLVREQGRNIVNSLKAHRAQQAEQNAEVDRLRKQLASTPVADVRLHQVQSLIDAMRDAGSSPATIGLERAMLRSFFNHARQQWKWTRPFDNPAGKGLNLPTVDNARDRVLTQQDWERVHVMVCLLLESAMRIGEPLVHVRWSDVDWAHSILHLPDGKTGKRKVPLSPNAVRLLEELRDADVDYAPEEKIFRTTYEAIKKAWTQSCKQAGITDIRLHDLRHTSATRYAIEFNGNLPYLKVITGHKTDAMLNRYINIKAEHVALAMHKKEIPPELAPAGYLGKLDPNAPTTLAHTKLAPNVIQGNFGRAAA